MSVTTLHFVKEGVASKKIEATVSTEEQISAILSQEQMRS
jgi:hypothetical protein